MERIFLVIEKGAVIAKLRVSEEDEIVEAEGEAENGYEGIPEFALDNIMGLPFSPEEEILALYKKAKMPLRCSSYF